MNEKLKNDIIFTHNVISFGLDLDQFKNTALQINPIKSYILTFIECLKSGNRNPILSYCVNNHIAINECHKNSVLFLNDFDFDFDILDLNNDGRNLLLVGNNFLTSAVLDPSILDKYDESDAIRMINISFNFDV